MAKILIPARQAEDWRCLLGDPEKQWKRGYSARTLAYCWQEAGGLFPARVRDVLTQHAAFRDPCIKPLLILPEHQVPLPGGSRPSQNDIWVLARCASELVSIAVEGKVDEPFGPTLEQWLKDASPGKKERRDFLCDRIGIATDLPGEVRYQLLHRTASAIIEAKRFMAKHAVVLVHSFSKDNACFDDFKVFVRLFGVTPGVDKFVSAAGRSDPTLHFAWVHGDERYLTA